MRAKMTIVTALFLVSALCVGFGLAIATEFIDPEPGTQYEVTVPFSDFQKAPALVLHKCGGSSFMVGVHVKKNQFLCEDGVGWFGTVYQPSDLTVNAMQPKLFERYQSHGMAACPPGKAMTGLHAARNVLLCAPLQMTDLFVDSHTYRGVGPVGGIGGLQQARMHACPKGSVMVGIHDARDLLLCGRVAIPPP